MRYPPIKTDRALLWVMLHPDERAGERYAALHAVLKACRLHPLDTTASAELVIVEEVAFRAHIEKVRLVLGEQDVLHLVTLQGGRLTVETIEATGTLSAASQRPSAQRPPWLP